MLGAGAPSPRRPTISAAAGASRSGAPAWSADHIAGRRPGGEALDQGPARDLIAVEAKNRLDDVIAKRAEEQAATADCIARSSHRPNLLAAVVFAVTALGALGGTNLPHGFEQHRAPWLFRGVLAFACLVGF